MKVKKGKMMSKKRFLLIICIILLAVIGNFSIIHIKSNCANETCKVNFLINADQIGNYQLYYGNDTNFTEEQSVIVTYKTVGKNQKLSFEIPCSSKYIRWDINQCVTNTQLLDAYVKYKGYTGAISQDSIVNSQNQVMIDKIVKKNGSVYIQTSGSDANITLNIQSLGLEEKVGEYVKRTDDIKKWILCIVLDLILCFIYKSIADIKKLLKDILINREMIFRLSKNDFMVKYAGSYFGIIWAFVQPMVTILLYWFVFQMGFRSGAVGETPFVLWLIAGMIPWFYFSDAISTGTNSLIEYSYLVKKVVFNISILPIVKVISALFVHLFFLIVMVLIFAVYGYTPDLYTIQIVYYLFCMFVFALGLAYIGSALIVFFRDLGQIINILLQIGMWMTPIMWQNTMLPKSWQPFLKLNPVYYIVSGYRDCLINKIPFWQHNTWTIYFWLFTAVVFLVGIRLFNKLKVHFADVL